MKTLNTSILIVLAILMAWMLPGCGDDHKGLAEDLSFYEPGEAVNAVKYNEALNTEIALYLLKEGGDVNAADSYDLISNGDYVPPGEQILGVKITSSQADNAADQRVYVSDGGWNEDFIKEAKFNENCGFYVPESNLIFQGTDVYLTHPVLIQVIYPNGTAAKEKFVITTDQKLRPAPGKLVQQGLGITLSANILDNLKEVMTPLIGEQLGENSTIEIKKLKPAADSETGVFHMDLGFVSLDLGFNDTYKNTDGETIRGLGIRIDNLSGGARPEDLTTPEALIEAMIGVMATIFLENLGLGDMIVNLLNLNEIPMMPISLPLKDMLSGFGGSGEPEEGDLMAEMLGNIVLDSTLFLNVKGLPEKTDSDFAAIELSLYAAGANLVEVDADGNALWPEVTFDDFNTQIDFSKIKNELTDFGIAMSQYNMNQMFGEMMRGFSILMKDMGEMMPFEPENPENTLDLEMTINPGGMAIDFNYKKNPDDETGARLAVSDVRINLIEAGEYKAELSMDITLDLDINIRKQGNDIFLDIAVAPQEDISYLHVMKDNLGLEMYDHSKFVILIFQGLAGAQDDGSGAVSDKMTISMSLSDMGLIPRAGTDHAGNIEYDGKGNCFMSLAVDSMNTEGLPLGCFISSTAF